MGRENDRNIGIAPPIHYLWPGRLGLDDITREVAEYNTDHGFPGYTMISRKHARTLFPFGEDAIPTSNPSGKYWFTPGEILDLQEEYIRNVQIQPFFSESIKLDDLPIRDKKAGETFRNAQMWLFYSYKQRNPVIQTLYEINPDILLCLESYYFQGKSKPAIIDASKGNLTDGSVSSYLALGKNALRLTTEQLQQGLQYRYDHWLAPLLQDWPGINSRIQEAPLELQPAIRKIVAGSSPKVVAREYKVSEDNLLKLINSIIYNTERHSAFASELKIDAIRRALEQNTPFNQMLHVKLLSDYLMHKTYGGSIESFVFPPDTNNKNITALLSHLRENIKTELDISTLPDPIMQIISAEKYSFYSTPQYIWAMLLACHDAIIQSMLESKTSYTSCEKAYLLTCVEKLKAKQSLTTEESIYLNTLLGNTTPRSKRRDQRQLWAESTIGSPNFPQLSPEEQALVTNLANGERLTVAGKMSGLDSDRTRSALPRIQKKLRLAH